MKRKPSRKVILEAIEQEILKEGPSSAIAGIKGLAGGIKSTFQNMGANYRLGNIGSQMDQFAKKAQKQWDTNVKQARKQTDKISKSSNPEIAQAGQNVSQQLDQADSAVDDALNQVRTGVARTMMGAGGKQQSGGDPRKAFVGSDGNIDFSKVEDFEGFLIAHNIDPKSLGKKEYGQLIQQWVDARMGGGNRSAQQAPDPDIASGGSGTVGVGGGPKGPRPQPNQPPPSEPYQSRTHAHPGPEPAVPADPVDQAADAIKNKYRSKVRQPSARVSGTHDAVTGNNNQPIPLDQDYQTKGQKPTGRVVGAQDIQNRATPSVKSPQPFQPHGQATSWPEPQADPIPLTQLKPQPLTPDVSGFKMPKQAPMQKPNELDSEIDQAAGRAVQQLPKKQPRQSDWQLFQQLQQKKRPAKVKSPSKKAVRAFVNKHGRLPTPDDDIPEIPKKSSRKKKKRKK